MTLLLILSSVLVFFLLDHPEIIKKNHKEQDPPLSTMDILVKNDRELDVLMEKYRGECLVEFVEDDTSPEVIRLANFELKKLKEMRELSEPFGVHDDLFFRVKLLASETEDGYCVFGMYWDEKTNLKGVVYKDSANKLRNIQL